MNKTESKSLLEVWKWKDETHDAKLSRTVLIGACNQMTGFFKPATAPTYTAATSATGNLYRQGLGLLWLY